MDSPGENEWYEMDSPETEELKKKVKSPDSFLD